jgi:quinol---cytochrome c reductase iron-sulfur subunit, bacillus type
MEGEGAHEVPPDAPPPEPAGRRGFLAALAAAGVAVVAAVAGVPLVAALLSPLRGREEDLGFVPVARLDALPEGRPVRASVVAARRDAWSRQPPMALGTVWLVRRGEAVDAFSAVCPHLGCGVESAAEGFACPCHGSAFAIDGTVRAGPAPRGLDPLEVRITQGERRIEVRWRRFVTGTSERREA